MFFIRFRGAGISGEIRMSGDASQIWMEGEVIVVIVVIGIVVIMIIGVLVIVVIVIIGIVVVKIIGIVVFVIIGVLMVIVIRMIPMITIAIRTPMITILMTDDNQLDHQDNPDSGL